MEQIALQTFPWALIAQWPTNDLGKALDKWAIKAYHLAKTPFRKETIVVVKDGVEYRRIRIGNKWSGVKIWEN